MNKQLLQAVLSFTFLLFVGNVLAQKDSLVLKNGNVMVGEVKSLDKGVLMIETDYSDEDFRVQWSGVKEVYTTGSFLLIHQSGRRFTSTLKSIPGTDSVQLSDEDAAMNVPIMEVVYLKELKSSFWSRMDASIDVGFNLTRANNLRQYNMNTKLGYNADKWELTATYTDNQSHQDSTSATKRTEANLGYKFFLQHDWYLSASINFLSNTEQALKLRTTGKIGAGKFIVHTNKKYWGVGGGMSLNSEQFSNDKASQKSPELYAATEVNLFDLENLNLLGNVYVYKSLRNGKRWRCDMKLDLKYDLPFDFYVKPGFTLNYDNQPAIVGNKVDYVITFSVGWEL